MEGKKEDYYIKVHMYNLVVENPESTVVAEYKPPYRKETAYQSEADLEKAFINLLQSQAYEYLSITSESDLISNLRCKLETLNNYQFTEIEWKQFFTSRVANLNMGVEEKTHVIQEDHIQLLTREDGTVKNIRLIDKENIHNNSLQVINQYETDQGQRPNRYDVTILVNGLPLVHVELKKRGVYIKEAFNQINRYSRESFWAGSGLFEYVQLFVISNGTHTKFYSNTTRSTHIREAAEGSIKKGKRTSNSFEFTSWWADANNRAIADLMDFGRTFFAKHTLLNVLIKYCVFTTDRVLLAMRPYQIVATEKILTRINVAHNYKTYGTVKGGGYIWHTTGSGKTLTSFKTAQIASKLPYIDKVLFVVDRKDLDYQTMKEYDKFQKGAANSNNSTAILKRQLETPEARIIITTIQKLAILINKHKNHLSYTQRIVIIFDECHRSQFGEMHLAITRTFKKYNLFGFTGTPIFAVNAGSFGVPTLRTTDQAFGERLHTYTIVDAINDKNVLPFRVDYIRTMKEEDDIADAKVWDIDREKALAAPQRISNIVSYILENFDRKTKRNSFYKLRDRRLAGFNSIFAVSSIKVAGTYPSRKALCMNLYVSAWFSPSSVMILSSSSTFFSSTKLRQSSSTSEAGVKDSMKR
jgi:type I restriction enzyme R subunit